MRWFGQIVTRIRVRDTVKTWAFTVLAAQYLGNNTRKHLNAGIYVLSRNVNTPLVDTPIIDMPLRVSELLPNSDTRPACPA
jgi:hypothetical protein